MFSGKRYPFNRKGYRFQNKLYLFYHDNKVKLFICYITSLNIDMKKDNLFSISYEY